MFFFSFFLFQSVGVTCRRPPTGTTTEEGNYTDPSFTETRRKRYYFLQREKNQEFFFDRMDKRDTIFSRTSRGHASQPTAENKRNGKNKNKKAF